MITAVVLDIEGTTSPTASVKETLYSYTRANLPAFMRTEAAAEVLAATDRDPERATMYLRSYIDNDVKDPALKVAQGAICHEGFLRGELHGLFFPDVPPALRSWKAAGKALYVYSSGSEQNQRDWFRYASSGRLDELITDYFDLSVGGKRDAASYVDIAGRIGVPAKEILFISDLAAELDAAAAAGWQVCGIHRPGEPNAPLPPHRWVVDFTAV
ncbi:acireductone synthase [Pseudonocardiaceae bacterium YIM PH 21723]|nr:acireductone synthase [Pseudonocardiaceae bacterium YIM PH 21723]